MTFKQVLKKYFLYALKDKKRYFSFVFLSFAQAVAVKIDPLIYGLIIDRVTAERYDTILIIISFLFLAKLADPIFRFLKEYVGRHVIIEHLWKGTHLEYMDALHHIDYEYHTNKSSGSLVSQSKRGHGAMPMAFYDINGRAFTIFLEFFVTFIILSIVYLPFALILLGTFVIALMIGYLLVRWHVKKRERFITEDDKITAHTVDNMIGFETIKIFANEKWERRRLLKKLIPWEKAIHEFMISFGVIDLVISLVTLIGIGIVFFVGVESLEAGIISIGTFVAAMVYVLDISRNTAVLTFKFRDIVKFYVDIKKYFEVMDLKPQIKDPLDPVEFESFKGNIDFKSLTFAYGSNKKNALTNINIHVSEQEKIALVGKSGSGKTTLTKLLMRFYDVKTGEVKIDGVNIKNVRLEDLRRSIGLVPQEAVLFNDTISYNIAYGKPNATQAEIESSAKKAQLHDFIMTLPKKYKTIVGERGIKLSGGQKQRLAIARVILENPPIIIFDEATSQLDSENERKIQKAFDSLTKNKTTIIIAHRLSTIMNSDRIIVFREGKIVQEGKHDDLIKKEGVYKKLWKLQTEVYE